VGRQRSFVKWARIPTDHVETTHFWEQAAACRDSSTIHLPRPLLPLQRKNPHSKTKMPVPFSCLLPLRPPPPSLVAFVDFLVGSSNELTHSLTSYSVIDALKGVHLPTLLAHHVVNRADNGHDTFARTDVGVVLGDIVDTHFGPRAHGPRLGVLSIHIQQLIYNVTGTVVATLGARLDAGELVSSLKPTLQHAVRILIDFVGHVRRFIPSQSACSDLVALLRILELTPSTVFHKNSTTLRLVHVALFCDALLGLVLEAGGDVDDVDSAFGWCACSSLWPSIDAPAGFAQHLVHAHRFRRAALRAFKADDAIHATPPPSRPLSPTPSTRKRSAVAATGDDDDAVDAPEHHTPPSAKRVRTAACGDRHTGAVRRSLSATQLQF
jgi:hypothetical protein